MNLKRYHLSFQFWYCHFEANRDHFADINWEEDSLKSEEKKIILSSIQQFQRGENSEGKHLFHASKEMKDPLYTKTTKLFILEEQTHGQVLGRFMEKHYIERIRDHRIDRVFRWLRKSAGLHQTIAVLLTSEIIAKVYYKALCAATGSLLLKSICVQILKDEDNHIYYQCYTSSRLYKKQNILKRIIGRNFHYGLMLVTIIIVWIYHRKVLRAGQVSFWEYCQESIKIFNCSYDLIRYQGWPLAVGV